LSGPQKPTLVANAAVAPDGSFTADQVDLKAINGATEYSEFYQPFTATAADWVGSIWAQAVSGSGTLYITLSNGSDSAVFTACTVTTTPVRCYVTRTMAAATQYFIIGAVGTSAGGGQPTTQPALSVYLWGAQVELGTTPSPYCPTLAAAATCGPGGATGKVVVNKALQSEALTTTWTTAKITSVTGGQADYLGGTSAWKLLEDNTSGYHYITQAWTAANVPTTYSIYAKAGTRNWIALSPDQGTSIGFFDLATCTLGTMTNGTGAAVSVGNGWCKLRFTATPAAGAQFMLVFMATGDGTHSYTGDGTGTVFLQNPQLEAATFAGPYCGPTGAAAKTCGPRQRWCMRAKDVTPGNWPWTYSVPSSYVAVDANGVKNHIAQLGITATTVYIDTYDSAGAEKYIQPAHGLTGYGSHTFISCGVDGFLTIYVDGTALPNIQVGTGTGLVSAWASDIRVGSVLDGYLGSLDFNSSGDYRDFPVVP
jgi:hypothetical protein